jgi:site-specific DNA recombinase
MPYAPEVDGPDLLGWWIRQNDRPTRTRRRPAQHAGGLRFAFYGRISTRISRTGSPPRGGNATSPGRSSPDEVGSWPTSSTSAARRLPWADRPQATLLLAALTDSDRGFDAIVVGEFERAFYGDQFQRMAPMFAYHGVQVWLPELDGPADITNDCHLALLTLLGVHSRREVQRARFRAKAAMQAPVTAQGRHLGGRPPYGYRLADAGPHPNRAHARWGRRATDSNQTREPHRTWSGCSLNALPAAASPRSPATSTSGRSPARPASTPTATRTAAATGGPYVPSRRSSPIPATPAGRCGTGNAPTTARWMRRATCSPGRTPAAGTRHNSGLSP